MKKEKVQQHLVTTKVKHEPVRWSNSIVDTPVVYGLIERRTLYFITGEVKHKYAEKNLGVPDNWKDLYFQLTDEDLGVIGGQKNVPRTYEALCKLGEKFLPVLESTKAAEMDIFLLQPSLAQIVPAGGPEIQKIMNLIGLHGDGLHLLR